MVILCYHGNVCLSPVISLLSSSVGIVSNDVIHVGTYHAPCIKIKAAKRYYVRACKHTYMTICIVAVLHRLLSQLHGPTDTAGSAGTLCTYDHCDLIYPYIFEEKY